MDLNISSKEPPAEMSGYGPALVIFLIALATMKVWLRHWRNNAIIKYNKTDDTFVARISNGFVAVTNVVSNPSQLN